jgi:hypothetical protein
LALHKQYLVPFADPTWPRSSVPDAETQFEGYPMTPSEQPAAPNPFPDNREPDWLMAVSLTDNHATFSEIALEGFRNLQAGNRDSPNLDLDADRGRRHACWRVANGTSIADPVLSVEILPIDSE